VSGNFTHLYNKLNEDFKCYGSKALGSIDLQTGAVNCIDKPKEYNPPTIILSGGRYKCDQALSSCYPIGTYSYLGDCYQPPASGALSGECVTDIEYCTVSFSGAIWGQKGSGDQGVCYLPLNPTDKQVEV
jgi:hypothetical protein